MLRWCSLTKCIEFLSYLTYYSTAFKVEEDCTKINAAEQQWSSGKGNLIKCSHEINSLVC